MKMNEETMNAIQIDRQKQRIFNDLQRAFYDMSLEDGEELITEASAELDDLQEKVFGYKQPTVKSCLTSLYELAIADSINSSDGSPVAVQDVQALFYNDIEQLADLLGIELED